MIGTNIRFLYRLLLLTGMILPVFTAQPPAFAHDVPEPDIATEGIPYKTEFHGIPKALEKSLPKYTDAVILEDKPPPSLYLLERRLQKDTESLVKALQSEGYYDANVTESIDAESKPVKAVFTIEPGAQYQLAGVKILLDNQEETFANNLAFPEKLDVILPKPLNYQEVITLGQNARNKIFDMNCQRWVKVRPILRLDAEAKTAEAVFYVTAGPEAKFGKVNIEGLQTIKPVYVERKIAWKEGECYKPAKTDSTQVALLGSNLFARADIQVAEEPDENGLVGVTMTMRERAQRTIKAGVGYASEEGFDFKPSWEHRNLFGEGERLGVDATLSTFYQQIGTTFERPAFLRNDQKLILNLSLSKSDTDAYTSTRIGGSGIVERQLTPYLLGGIGIGYSISEVDDGLTKDVYSLLSFPTYLEHSTRDDTLDPTKGHVLRLDVEPLIETLQNGNTFLKSQGTAKFYHQHTDLPAKPTWAFRATLGSIAGSTRDDIPADERFFSGGGGSVRGYAYQLLGPLTDGAPDGGRSLAEFSGELRLRVTDTIGVVPFADAGNVYNQIYPEVGNLFYAAGLGLRYFSDFGPFRFDLAFPLDKRDNVDDSYQFYISFGQSF